MNVAFSLKSRNAKTGNIPVSTSEASTCPDACPLKGACYAKHGPLGMFWAKVNDGRANAYTWDEFIEMVRALPEGQLWRHNQAGDLPGTNNGIDGAMLSQLVEANRGKRGFTYTHKPVTNNLTYERHNKAYIQFANANGFTINLSADNMAEADELADLNIGPVVVIVARDADNMETPKGRKVVICPAQRSDEVTCKTCGLCAKADRSSIVGFRAHGVSAKKAEALALA